MLFRSLIITSIFIAICCLWYLCYVSARAKKRSAITHIVERITARELAGESLAGELREILLERDEIIEDRFDRLIKDAIIIRDYDFKKASDLSAMTLEVKFIHRTRMILKAKKKNCDYLKDIMEKYFRQPNA